MSDGIREHSNKNGQKVFEYRFEVAPVNGKRKQITKRGFKTRKEARRARQLAMAQYENTGRVISPSDMSFSDYLDLWIEEDCKVDLKPTTVENYQKKIKNHIKPVLGGYTLRSIRKENLQALINGMYDNGYARNTLSCITGILSKCFNYAVDNEYLLTSPAVRLKIPKGRTPTVPTRSAERDCIPLDIIHKILERFPEGSPNHIPLRLGFECGMRIAEAFAVVWEDVDFQNKTITVNRQIQWQADTTRTTTEKLATNGKSDCGNGYWYFTNPKYNSARVIDISDSFVELLKREQERQRIGRDIFDSYTKNCKEEYKYYYAKNPLVFDGNIDRNAIAENPINNDVGNPINFICIRKDDGTYITSRTMQHTSTIIRRDIYSEFSFHALRHTHASMLYESGQNDKFITERMGHANDRVTKAVYIHLTDTAREQGKIAVNDMFNSFWTA